MIFSRRIACANLFSFFSALLFISSVEANSSANCYEILIKNSPAREFPIDRKTEIWCYQHLNLENKVFIYNADQDHIAPEMALLIDANGIITHASRRADEITVHKINQHIFNPFSIPLQEPTNQLPIVSLKHFSTTSILSVQKLLLNADMIVPEKLSLYETENLIANSSILPWQGFWWPRKNMPMLTPLSKYDRFVNSRTGISPGSVAWERQNHAYHGVDWSGHCNGWAAASILHAEPVLPKTDPVSETVFSVSDQKGILTEADYCVSAAFFGNRNYGAGNNGDIRPELFHKTLLYYIGSLHKAVIMDYHPDSSVDNHVISGYNMEINAAGENRYTVTTTLSMHGYDNFPSNTPGVARPYTRKYSYILLTDAQGTPTGGNWLSGNPDFMWVPLSPMNCQKLDYKYINAILDLQ